jgi:hypothetical protein
MRRFLLTSILSLATVAFVAGGAPALRIAIPAPQTTQQKTLQSETVVIGKVTSIEKETVEAEQYQGGKQKATYTIAVIKVETGIIGAKNITHVKVGFLPQVGGDQPVPQPGGPIRPIRPGFIQQNIQLKADQEGIFFLSKHHGGEFYIINPMSPPIDAKAENYKDETAKVKAIAATIADPLKGLKAEKASDRFTAASVLVSKYRTGPQNAPLGVEEVAIPAEESKLIMKAIVEADWDKDANSQDHPQNLVAQLGIYAGAHGIPQFVGKPNDPNPGETYRTWFKEEVKKWYAKRGDKFEVKQYVAKKK